MTSSTPALVSGPRPSLRQGRIEALDSRWAEIALVVAVWALGLGYVALMFWPDPSLTDPALVERQEQARTLDLLVGHIGLALFVVRHRHPVAITLLLGAMMVVSSFAAMPYLFAMVSLATYQRLRPIVLGMLMMPLATLVYSYTLQRWLHPEVVGKELGATFAADAVYSLVIGLIFVLLGWNTGARRELAAHAAERAASAEREHAARLVSARMAERTGIAREMHDALGHRLSVVAMHSNGLAYRQDLSPEEVRETSTTIATQARTALNDLREILGVLRSDIGQEDQTASAMPDLRHLPQLVGETRGAGCTVRLEVPERLTEEAGGLPQAASRHAYRVVQESLTNACKHAPGQPVHIALSGQAGAGLALRVVNRLPAPGEEPADVVSGGMGLTGMQERVHLAGGRFSAQAQEGEFVVDAWLPWPAA
ncbi:two-component sensor histidine kinase [Kytococcus schroeteri]|uniref:histidine kinase n=1 Tax=Kytococcus schroeteri TaxID=138300 RepID=A0A2I1PA55_9MICO|nr:histidine kinase [Kytococcus schroeteri]PKZ41505.1 two-component sensor histidine kinase [Kytococcus schroeteri]